MNCPRCEKQVNEYIFDRNSDMCCQCGYYFSKSEMKQYMEPQDCQLVRDGEIDPDDFDPDCNCEYCEENCALAFSCIDDFEYDQDEEGNWGYDD